MGSKITRRSLFLLLFLLASPVYFGIPAYFVWHDAMFIRSGQSAQGVVVGYEAQDILRGGQRYCAIIEFTHQEATVRFTDDWCHRSQTDFRQGTRVPVVFNPDDPSDAQIDDSRPLFRSSLIVGILTVPWLLVGIFGLITLKR
ncbi:DUF3592 domain-containing protein [Thermomonas sp.]|uniref:DUF3592 domain-containing protein n=1 Tax=Thermomonas sp. TaxID=1971895 RepID=UPI002C1C70DB|nr:DUF3592 domain-containing protein [Thermomonas sp.]HRO62988.1 DUF3592 domain-containing protein [Thermomonas sp.]